MWRERRSCFPFVEPEAYPKRFLTFDRFVKSELAQEIDLWYRLIGRKRDEAKNLSNLCEKRKSYMISSLMTLLQIFERAGSNLEDCLKKLRQTGKVEKDEVVETVKLQLENMLV